nr:hypothetical protein [Paenibacillus timonensis]
MLFQDERQSAVTQFVLGPVFCNDDLFALIRYRDNGVLDGNGLMLKADGVPFEPDNFTASQSVKSYFVKAIKGPMPHVSIMPTGGVDLENMGKLYSFVNLGFCRLCGKCDTDASSIGSHQVLLYLAAGDFLCNRSHHYVEICKV